MEYAFKKFHQQCKTLGHTLENTSEYSALKVRSIKNYINMQTGPGHSEGIYVWELCSNRVTHILFISTFTLLHNLLGWLKLLKL